MPLISSMDNCQPQQAIEPGRKAPQTNGKEANPEEIHDDDDVCEEEANQGSSSRSSDGVSNAKIKIYLHQRVEKNLEDKLRVSKLKWKRQWIHLKH